MFNTSDIEEYQMNTDTDCENQRKKRIIIPNKRLNFIDNSDSTRTSTNKNRKTTNKSKINHLLSSSSCESLGSQQSVDNTLSYPLVPETSQFNLQATQIPDRIKTFTPEIPSTPKTSNNYSQIYIILLCK